MDDIWPVAAIDSELREKEFLLFSPFDHIGREKTLMGTSGRETKSYLLGRFPGITETRVIAGC